MFFNSRREFLFGLGTSLGTVALNSLLAAEQQKNSGPLSAKPAHHRPRAKACIFVFMEGGPSHLDTFDPKPQLTKLHMKQFVRKDKFASAMASGKRYFVKSPFQFQQAGESGLWMCEHFEHLAKVADHLCVYQGMVGESINHPTACYHLNTGNRFVGDPALGAWAGYGLGTINQDLPSFVVLPERAYPQGGAANWSCGFLPAYYQASPLRPNGPPILDLEPPPGVTRDTQQQNLQLLTELNTQHHKLHPQHDELLARMQSYELAFRMQTEVPRVLDIHKESEAIKQLYGIGEKETDRFGRKCLLARNLIENGVRFVQLYTGGWDSHDYIERAHRQRIRTVDKPLTGLISDLSQRGLLDETLIICAGEFGRSPDNGLRGGAQVAGRDHNANARSVLLAGGGVRAGRKVGATDEIGDKAVEVVHPIKDFHVTLLHLLGLDDNRLTYFHEGRFKQLSQTGGKVIKELLA